MSLVSGSMDSSKPSGSNRSYLSLLTTFKPRQAFRKNRMITFPSRPNTFRPLSGLQNASKSKHPFFGANETGEHSLTQASKVSNTPTARFMRNLTLRDWEIDYANFLKAMRKADLKTIRQILVKQPTIARQSSFFSIAAENGERTALHFLADGKPVRTDSSFKTLQLIVRLCKAFGADFNATDRDGTTPLMLAAASCDIPLVELLLENKANINAQDSNGYTVLDYVRINPSTETQSLLDWLIAYQKDLP